MAVNPFYQRLTSSPPLGRTRIAVHYATALLGEWGRGEITGTQAQNALAAIAGQALDSTEAQQAQDLVATVTTGSTTANQAARALDILRITDCLMLLEAGAAGFTTQPGDLTGTAADGAAGGKLGVPRRDSP